jgi:prenyltransferase beta subunit
MTRKTPPRDGTFDLPRIAELRVSGGGFCTGQYDLFATYSAADALQFARHRPNSHLTTARAVLARASAQGVGETAGAPEDAWSTTYASGILFNLGYVAPPAWARFLTSLRRDGGYAMFPGGTPDAWATGFASLAHGRFDPALVDKAALARWAGSAQAADGGITWTPADAPQGVGDVRATAFIVDALRQVSGVQLLAGYLDVAALVDFVMSRQCEQGGFTLGSPSPACMWGTGEAIVTLDALKIPIPNQAAVIEFVMSNFDKSSGGFCRGPAYPQHADVWATRQAARVLHVLAPRQLAILAPRIVAFLGSCELRQGGYTYTQLKHAGDTLSTAAALLAGYGDDQTPNWLSSCVMPGEGGFAYMPGRGSEARTSQWATAALDALGVPYDTEALLAWATHVQNADGGYGRWAGRVSEPVATTAVVATLSRARGLHRLPGLARLGNWVGSAIDQVNQDAIADAVLAANLTRTAVAINNVSGDSIDVAPCLRVIDGLGVDGGYRRSPRAVADLATTYAVLLAHQSVAETASLPAARAWLNNLPVYSNGVGWSPASSEGGGLLSTALATLVVKGNEGTPLPDLSL